MCRRLDVAVGPNWIGIATNNGTESDPEWTCHGTNVEDFTKSIDWDEVIVD